MTRLAQYQYRDLGWKDSIFEPQCDSENVFKVKNSSKENFFVTEEIIDKWGYGYSDEEYFNFEKKWNKLIDNYGEKTALHTEALIIYIRFRVKEELATANGDVVSAEKWARMAKEAATSAKINVLQLSKSDLNGGIELVELQINNISYPQEIQDKMNEINFKKQLLEIKLNAIDNFAQHIQEILQDNDFLINFNGTEEEKNEFMKQIIVMFMNFTEEKEESLTRKQK